MNLVAVTMDPRQDTPPVLAAYTLHIFWGALGATWREARYPGTPPTDLLDRIDLLLGGPAEAMRAPETAARPGDTAPPLSLHALGGGPVSLTAEAGHPVVLNFWATWCTPCRAELPRLERAASDDPGLRVLAIDEGEAASDVAAFLRGIPGAPGTMRVLLDPDRAAGRNYQVLGLPVTVFVDAGGTVRAVHIGEIDAADLEDALRMLR